MPDEGRSHGRTGGRRPPILVVDDEPTIAEMTRRHIAMRIPGVEILVCTDAEVALQVVAASDIAVLLCDLRMPVLQGTEILAEAHRRNPDIVSILVTGYATKDALLDAVNVGHVWRVIEKPWHAEALCDSVAEALEIHRKRAAARPGASAAKPRIRIPAAPPAPVPAARRAVRIVVNKPGARPAPPPAPPARAAPGARPTFAPPVKLPRVAARYTGLQMIGQGGLGAVYRAHDSLLDIPVVLKLISEPFARDPKVVEGLVAEARDAVQLSHPNIVRLHTLERQGGLVYLVMEFIDGATLRRILTHSGRLPVEAVLAVADACAAALAYAHGHGVHHLDLKPDNLMIDSKHVLRIIDFGLGSLAALAKPDDEDVVGTPFYMSPEQARGGRPGPAMDIYSLGVTLHELLTGSMPDHAGDTMPDHTCDYRPISASELDPDVQAVLNRSFAQNPADRFDSAAALAAALRQAAGTGPRPG